MKTSVRILLLFFISLIIAGCASMSFYPGAKKIVITEKPVSKNCKWLKKITVVNPAHAALTPYQHALLEQNEFNKLRNQAAQVGGNMVFLSEYRMIKRENRVKQPGRKPEESHMLVAQVYKCPPGR